MASLTTSDHLELQPGHQKRQQTRKSPADSRQPRRTRKKRRIAKATKESYGVKGIIDESDDKYLIDWEDDPATGRRYSPTWEPKKNANCIAVEAWEENRRGDEPQSRPEKTNINDSSSDSEPIPIAKRKRLRGTRTDTESRSSPLERATKLRRLSAGIRQVARTSFSSGVGLEKDEIEDSFEGEVEVGPIQVAHDSIDTSAYVSAASESTQSSLSIHTEIYVQNSLDIQEAYEHNSTEAVIPDSQDISTFSKKLLESQNNSNTQSTNSQYKTSNDRSYGSGEQDSSQVFGLYSRTNNEEPQNSGENSILSHFHPGNTTAPAGINSIAGTQSCIDWLTVKPFSNQRSSIGTEHQRATSRTSRASQGSDIQLFRVASQHSLSPRQQESQEPESIAATSLNSRQKQALSPGGLEIAETQEEVNSQIQSVFSTSGSEEIWQSAQGISSINLPPTFQSSSDRLSFENFQDSSVSLFQEENSQDSIARSVLSQQNGNLVKSLSQPKELTGTSQELLADNNYLSHKSNSQLNYSQGSRLSLPNTEYLSNEEARSFDSFLPVPLIPSSGLPELPETYGSNIPRRLKSLSYFDMSGNQDSMDLESNTRAAMQGLSVREQMRLRRAETAASRPISVVRTHSDSPVMNSASSVPPVRVVPDMPILASAPIVPSSRPTSLTPARVSSPQLPTASVTQMSAQSNSMLPNRGITVSTPHLPLKPYVGHNGALKEEKDTGTTHATALPRLGVREYIVPLPMMSTIRKVYENAIRNNKHEIQEFISNDMGDPQLVLKMEKMIDTLKKLGDHQDIDTPISASQTNMSDDQIKKWAETCSTKCAFVRELLDALQSVQVHVAILARPGRMLDILEVICRSQRYVYDRPDQLGNPSQHGSGPLRVTLLPTGNDGKQYPTTAADMVIAFDETSRLGEMYSGILRSGHHDTRKLSPLIFLVVANSAEHLELCIPRPPTKSRERTQALVNAIVERRHEVGKLDVDDFQPNQAAVRVARYLTSLASGNVDAVWPLPKIDDIPGIEFTGVQFRPDSSIPFSNQLSGHMQVPLVPRSSTKRSWDGSDTTDPDNNKRARSTPVPGETNMSADASRVSDTVGSQSQMRSGHTVMEENSGASGVKSEYQDLISQNSTLLAQVAALSLKVTDLESQLLSKQQAISNLYKVVKDRDHSIEVNIAPKYQQAIKESAEAAMNLKAVSEHNENLLKRSEQRDAEIQKLKEEKTTIQGELDAARTTLSSSSIPEVAELAKKDEEIRSLREAVERQEKKTASAENLNEFIRDQYQKASSAAADANNELATKDAKIADLSRKADENRVICAQAQAASEKEESDQRILELEALLQDREDELARKREELKVRSTRRETRGVSVPRSPAMVPSPRVAGSRSRAGSPAVGELGRDGGDTMVGASTRRIRQLVSERE